MRLRGLGLGRVGVKNPKNSHKGVGWCEFRTSGVVLCEFRTMHYSLVQDAKFVVLSNGKNLWVLRVGNAS